MIRQLSYIVTVLFGLTSCASQYNIDGNSSLACLDGQKLYLRITNFVDSQNHVVNIDSCEVIHGRFNFGGNIDSIAMVEVYMGNERLMPIVLEGGELLMQVDNYGQSVTGGPLNERLTDFLKKRSRYDNELWEIDRTARVLLFEGIPMNDVIKKLEPQRRAVVKKIEDMEVQFVLENSSNVLGPGYFMQMANQMVFPTMTEPLLRIAENAPPAFFRSPAVRNFLLMAGYSRSLPPLKASKKRK